MRADAGERRIAVLTARMRRSRGAFEGVRRRRAARELGELGSPDAATALARAVVDRLPGVRGAARRELSGLTDPAAIDAVCRIWSETRSETLGEVVAAAGWVASGPAAVRMLTALHAGRPEVLADGDAAVAGSLLDLIVTGDRLAAPATAAVSALRRQDARDVVCARAIHERDESTRAAALGLVADGGFVPADPTERALLFFLTGDLERYEELDPDGSLLADAMAVADDGLRGRLAARARATGSVAWVRALARSPAEPGSDDQEWASALSVLTSAGDLPRLWETALEAPPVWGVRMLRALTARGWRPEDTATDRLWERLRVLAARCDAQPGDAPVRLGTVPWMAFLGATRDGLLVVAAREKQPPPYQPPTPGVEPQPEPIRIDIWDTGSRQLLHHLSTRTILPGHAVALHRRVLVAHGPEELLRWEPSAPRLQAIPTRHEPAVPGDIALSPSGDTLVASDLRANAVLVWRLTPGSPRVPQRLSGPRTYITDVAVTPDGEQVLSLDENCEVHRWSLDGVHLGSYQVVEPADHHRPRMAISDDSRLLVVHTGLNQVQVHELETGRLLAGIIEGVVCDVDFTPDGSAVLVGVHDGRVSAWRTESGAFLGTVAAGSPGNPRTYVAAVRDDLVAVARQPSDARSGGPAPPGTVELVHYGAALVRAAARQPVADIDQGVLAYCPGDAWADLIRELVQWRHRYDVEVDDAEPGTDPGGRDIELEG